MKLSLENGLVLMAMHGSLVPLRVLSQDGDRLTLVDSNDTVHKVSPKRLYWISEHRAETHEELNTHWASIDELAHTVDIAALWESCADSHASEGLCPSVLAERAFGNQSSAAIDACILAAFRDGRHFKLRERLLRVTSAARIMAFNQAQEQQRQADQECREVHRRDAADSNLRGQHGYLSHGQQPGLDGSGLSSS